MCGTSLRRVTWEYCKNSIRICLNKKNLNIQSSVKRNRGSRMARHVKCLEHRKRPMMIHRRTRRCLRFSSNRYVYYDNTILNGVFTWNRVWKNTNSFQRYISDGYTFYLHEYVITLSIRDFFFFVMYPSR